MLVVSSIYLFVHMYVLRNVISVLVFILKIFCLLFQLQFIWFSYFSTDTGKFVY